MAIEDDPKENYGRMAWALRYMLDWPDCGMEVTYLRLYTTIIRWFTDRDARLKQLGYGVEYVRLDDPPLSDQHRLNLVDLLDTDVYIPMDLRHTSLACFFGSLHDGDVITGGPTEGEWPPKFAEIRPGYGYIASKWLLWFPDQAPPWPFWIFPRKVDIAEA